MQRKPILVTGASGYVGRLLVPRLLEAGHPVRCLVRDPRKRTGLSWWEDPRVEILEGDAGETEVLDRVLQGCATAYYLIHSMIAAGGKYRDRDREIAKGFAQAASRANLDRIIYLGGLGETGPNLSEHLTSRREVEEVLRTGSTPVTVLRAAMIIGAESASFKILLHLVKRLPVMVTPKWVQTESQPIAIQDALHYLVAALETPETTGRTFDIGGPDVLTYQDLMKEMAEALGLRRRPILPLPVLTPHLSSLWIHLVTPVSRRIAQPLAMGLKNRVVCRDDAAVKLMPHRRLSIREAIEAALHGDVEPGGGPATEALLSRH